MSSRSRDFVSRIVQSGFLMASKIGCRAAVAPLALAVMLLAPGPAQSHTLQVETTWPGQYDTENGARPDVGSPLPTCAPGAEPTIAVGNSNYQNPIELAANWNFGYFRTNGISPFQEPIQRYFNDLFPNNNNIIEQSINLLFDETQQRFVLAGTARNNNNNVPNQSWIVLAATELAIVTSGGANCVFGVDANFQPDGPPTNFFANFVRLGMTADSLVVVADMFDFNTDAFQYSKLWVLRKADLYDQILNFCPNHNPSPSLILSGFKMPDGSTFAKGVAPANSYDANSSVTYLAAAWAGSGSELALWTLDTQRLALSPGITGASVPTAGYSFPPKAAQKGTTTQIDLGDASLTNAVYQPTSGLWTVHTVACPSNASLSCFKWYQIDPQAGTTVQDSSFGYTDSSVFSPSVAVDRRGDAVFVFNSSGTNFYVGVNYVGRDAIDRLNGLQSSFALISGASPFERAPITRSPGRKTSAVTDPTSERRFWMIGAYASGIPTFDRNPLACKGINQVLYNWSTQVAAVSFTAPPSAAHYDFNGDEYSDILWQNDNGEAYIWEINGLTNLGGGSPGSPPPSWQAMGSGDFNGDGKADILWQNTDGTVVIWLMDGTNVVNSAVIGNPGPSWHAVRTGYFKGGTKADILWRNDDGRVAIWLMDGTNVIGSAILGNPGTSWHIVDTGDFNRDDHSDILWQNDNGAVVVWEMNGLQMIGSTDVGNPGPSWRAIAAGDFNGDGYADILWQNASGEVVIWELQAGNIIGSASLGNPGVDWHPVRTANFNADPYSDILWQNTSGEVVIWLMKGFTTIASASLGNPGHSWHAIGP